MANTRHDWLTEIIQLSKSAASLNLLGTLPDETYRNQATKTSSNADAFNLSSSPEHNQAIARWIDGLDTQGIARAQLSKMLGELTSRNTYGAFAELAAYGTLLDAQVPFDIQVPVTAKDILNPNGSDLDGCIKIGTDVLFDVKAFGLFELLSKRLRDRLETIFKNQFVAIEGSGDVGVPEMTDLLGRGFVKLEADLRATGKAVRGPLQILLRQPQQTNLTTSVVNPYELAKNNAEYVFNFAKQFARRKPFILIFVLHPWMGGLRLTTNFSNDADIFTRSFSRRAFMQFKRDRTKVFGVTRATASRLLSGIMFLDAWQAQNHTPEHWLYLNPNARHPVSGYTKDVLQSFLQELTVDGFEHDTY